MVIKISNESQNEEKKFLGIIKPIVLPNGDRVFLLTQGDPFVCETREEESRRFITKLEVHLGEYSYLKEEVIRILTNLMHVIEIPEFLILKQIKWEISPKLKKKGIKKRDIKKIRDKFIEEIYDIYNKDLVC